MRITSNGIYTISNIIIKTDENGEVRKTLIKLYGKDNLEENRPQSKRETANLWDVDIKKGLQVGDKIQIKSFSEVRASNEPHEYNGKTYYNKVYHVNGAKYSVVKA